MRANRSSCRSALIGRWLGCLKEYYRRCRVPWVPKLAVAHARRFSIPTSSISGKAQQPGREMGGSCHTTRSSTTATQCTKLQHIEPATEYNMLQHIPTATEYNMLQHVAMNRPAGDWRVWHRDRTRPSPAQVVSARCKMLYYVATMARLREAVDSLQVVEHRLPTGVNVDTAAEHVEGESDGAADAGTSAPQ